MPIQKLGSNRPASARVMQSVSTQPLGQTPAMTPGSSEQQTDDEAADGELQRVGEFDGDEVGDRLTVRKLSPKSPRAALARKLRYARAGWGLGEPPSLARAASMAASLMGVPGSMSSTGSPGTRRVAPKTTVQVMNGGDDAQQAADVHACSRATACGATPIDESFLVLFFKKEQLEKALPFEKKTKTFVRWSGCMQRASGFRGSLGAASAASVVHT